MKKIVIFASGNGSNAEKIALFFKNHPRIKVTHLYCNNKEAGVIQKFINLNIPHTLISKSSLEDSDFLNHLQISSPDLIVLSGFLLKIPEKMITQFPNKIINIHPSLLPKYGGKGMYGMHVHKAVFEAKENISGISIHFVNELYDEGQIIFQATVDITACLNPEAVAREVLALEHIYFAPTIQKLVLSE